MLLAVSKPSCSYSQPWHHAAHEDVATTSSMHPNGAARPSRHFDRKRYRPTEHFQTEHSWMNDTIGPIYNPDTGLYHLYCQWNPKGTEWGNMSWYAATSKDLVNWTPCKQQPALKPNQHYDREGIFTGYALPRGIHGEKGQMTALYTSVTSPTIHWTLPYEHGSEGVSIATSLDGGLTWTKDARNPIIRGSPEGIEVTGFRDPSIASLPKLDQLLGRQPGKYLYATLSGGIAGQTPTFFLYSLPVDDLTQWEFHGPAVDIGLDYRPDPKWCGEGGRNFECCSLFELESKTTLITSTEGGQKRWSLWLQGEMSMDDGKPKLAYRKSGVLDWGCFYAASTSRHPVDGRQLIMGWIPEDDLTVEQRRAQGWAGMACLPRELVHLEYNSVTKAIASPVSEIGSIDCEKDGEGAYTVRTVGIRPAKELLSLRERGQRRRVPETLLTSSNKSIRLPLQRKTWEVEFEADILQSCLALNIVIQHSSNEYTLITFDPQAEKIVVDREYSTILPDVKTASESGAHTLFSFRDKKAGEDRQEPLRIRLFFDMSVIELYANDRFALTTRVYPASCGPASLSIVAEMEEGSSAGGPVSLSRLSSLALWER